MIKRPSELRQFFKSEEEIYEEAAEGRQFNFVYFLMLVMACLIALLGLLLNSPAVIIGAMLISPLMGPILACGLALTLADGVLGWKAGRNLALSVGEVLLIAALATWFSPLKELTPEILARANPNLMDLLIAFFSGLAGTLALTSRKSGLTILPGVAIATAVMPPLATIGYGFSTRQWAVTGGACMLFLTNIVAIVLSSGLVYLLVGFRPRHDLAHVEHRLLVRSRIVIAVVLLVALSVPLMRTLLHAAQQSRSRKSVASALRARLQAHSARLVNFDINDSGTPVAVDAFVGTPKFIETTEVQKMQDELAGLLGQSVQLKLEQVVLGSEEQKPAPPADDYLAGGWLRSGVRPEPPRPVAEVLTETQDRVEGSLGTYLGPLGVSSLTVRTLGRQENGAVTVDFEATQDQPTDPGAWNVAVAALASELGAPVKLQGEVTAQDDEAAVVHFPPRSSRAKAADLRRVRQFADQWKGREDLRFLLVASPDWPPKLRERRLQALRQLFPKGRVTDAPAEDASDGEAIRYRVVQKVEAAGQPPPILVPSPQADPALPR
jgi:uncharacterized hydrophobic protein (TIGR00271 family)